MKTGFRPYIALALLVAAGGALSDTGGSGGTTMYRWVDEQGVVHYSDTPQAGAERLQIKPAQTFSAQAISAPPTSSTQASAPPVAHSCTITQPSAEQSFYSPDAVVVSVQVAPKLADGEQLAVTLDGQRLSPADDSGLEFQVANPDRGEHTVQALVRGADGQTVCNAAAVTFYVQRPSLLSPQAPAHGHGAPTAPGH